MAASMDREQDLLDCIGALYDAAAEPALWPGMAARLARLFESESALLLTADARGGRGAVLAITDNLDGGFLADYEAHYHRHDQWIAGGLRQPDRAVFGRDLAPPEWYRSSEFLHDHAVRAGIYHLVGGAMTLGGAVSGVVGIHRPRARADFEEDDRRRMAGLLPHITRAMQLTLRLGGARIDYQAALSALERTGTAVLVVVHGGLILSANSLAELLLRQGGSLKAVNGRLTGTCRKVAARLAILVQQATDAASAAPGGGPGGGIAIERDDGRLPVTILVTPFRPGRPGLGMPFPTALVFVRDPETPSMATEILRDLFGLTPAQAAVAARLGSGESLEEIAEALHITRHTANDHLKQVFAKTGCRRQPQLAALLSRTVAGLRDEIAAAARG
jgi:DNA-binding CsgD family transcriptional regulator